MSEKIKVVIDRAKWRTGQNGFNSTGEGKTMLLNPDGYMCCLGFCCKAAGVPAEGLIDRPKPDAVSESLKKNLSGMSMLLKPLASEVTGHIYLNCSNLAWDAMQINDCEDTKPEEKEQEILELFKNSNFEIEFTGEYQAEEENV
jgi:hypothetical protein